MNAVLPLQDSALRPRALLMTPLRRCGSHALRLRLNAWTLPMRWHAASDPEAPYKVDANYEISKEDCATAQPADRPSPRKSEATIVERGT
jgi:hypothetical protein